ncbi:O-acetylhomoserine (thiol)-lyase, putative [Talaromyces stipitatus ATCC 10500]|nr:O-acetylhomoserine (thiol)-lyase, putative [Talaromyces stipitatus ATCC 10500]EED20767.1 O-acetylhomoserine (thiol)-lyase, putative [Talaromyces stipitatus ATCC 10500]
MLKANIFKDDYYSIWKNTLLEDAHNVQSGTGALTTPIYASTSFTFNNSQHGADIFAGKTEDFAYSRLGNPTSSVFEQRIAALEGGAAALPTSSGEAAHWMAIAALAMAGENIIAPSTISEETYTLFKYRLPPLGINVKFVDINDTDSVRDVIDEKTRAVYIESISSVSLEIADIEAVASVAHEVGVPLVVDNTAGVAGYLIRPIDHGADIVINSTSEWVTGTGTTVSGVIVDSGKFPWKTHSSRFPHLTTPSPGYHGLNFAEAFGEIAYILYVRMAILRDGGPCLNPFATALALAGLGSLSARMDRHNSNALSLAAWLQTHENVTNVTFPGITAHSTFPRTEKYLRQKAGYGAVLHFGLKKGGAQKAAAFIANLKLIKSSHGLGTPQ